MFSEYSDNLIESEVKKTEKIDIKFSSISTPVNMLKIQENK